MAWTSCGDWGVEAISDVLKVNTVVTDLNLYHNDVGPRGASALARALRKNYTLHILNLDMNNIGDEGVQVYTHIVGLCAPIDLRCSWLACMHTCINTCP